MIYLLVTGSGSLIEGSDYTLTCNPFGNDISPQIFRIVGIRWLNGSVELPGETSLILRLTTISRYDSGTYTCLADLFNIFDNFPLNDVPRTITIEVIGKQLIIVGYQNFSAALGTTTTILNG